MLTYNAHELHRRPRVVVGAVQVFGVNIELLAYARQAHLRTAAVLHELFIDELTVTEAVIYAGEFVALALISQMFYVVENAVPHNYLIGLFQHILYLFVEFIELGLSAEILLLIRQFYLRSALFSSQIKTRSGILIAPRVGEGNA